MSQTDADSSYEEEKSVRTHYFTLTSSIYQFPVIWSFVRISLIL